MRITHLGQLLLCQITDIRVKDIRCVEILRLHLRPVDLESGLLKHDSVSPETSGLRDETLETDAFSYEPQKRSISRVAVNVYRRNDFFNMTVSAASETLR